MHWSLLWNYTRRQHLCCSICFGKSLMFSSISELTHNHEHAKTIWKSICILYPPAMHCDWAKRLQTWQKTWLNTEFQSHHWSVNQSYANHYITLHYNHYRTIDLLEWNSLIDDREKIPDLLVVPNVEVSVIKLYLNSNTLYRKPKTAQ